MTWNDPILCGLLGDVCMEPRLPFAPVSASRGQGGSSERMGLSKVGESWKIAFRTNCSVWSVLKRMVCLLVVEEKGQLLWGMDLIPTGWPFSAPCHSQEVFLKPHVPTVVP